MQFIDEDIFLLAPTDYRVMPWKNGGGTTREILVHPFDTESFDWRLSIADVQTDGPFSPFPGYARTIMLLEGDGMRLAIDGLSGVTVREKYRPLDFDGGSATYCTLTGGPIRDFNIMSAKARASHECEVIEHFPAAPSIPSGTAVCALFALQGTIRARITGTRSIDLQPGYTLLLSAPRRIRQLNGDDNSKALFVSFSH